MATVYPSNRTVMTESAPGHPRGLSIGRSSLQSRLQIWISTRLTDKCELSSPLHLNPTELRVPPKLTKSNLAGGLGSKSSSCVPVSLAAMGSSPPQSHRAQSP